MPATNEIVNNRPLSGNELKEILKKDFARMLDNDGMFAGHIGYRRVAYKIRLQMHLDNANYPEHSNQVESKPPARNIPPDNPVSKITGPPPIADATNDVVVGVEHERVIDSPNASRLQEGMPVQVPSLDRQTGRTIERPVTYSGDGVKPDATKDKDISEETAKEWNLT